MLDVIGINKTLAVVIGCWEDAENTLRDKIRIHSPGLQEEEITSRFHEVLAETLQHASTDGRIGRAFLEDLRQASYPANYEELGRLSRGLIAGVSLHPRETEAATGGDLGLIIVRPRVTRSYDGNLLIARGHRRGLLCQAKLKHAKGKWGTFTVRQRKVLARHLPYLALLLYRYSDTTGRELESFQWQSCAGSKLTSLVSWLQRGAFPGLVNSRTVLLKLGADKIGTSDIKILDEVICPPIVRYLTLWIDWPDDRGPEISVKVRSKDEARAQVEIHVRH